MKINRSELFAMAWRIARTTATRENCKASECLAYGLSEAWKIFKASASGRPVIHSVTRSLPAGSMHVSCFNVITGHYETTIYKNGKIPKSVILWCLGDSSSRTVIVDYPNLRVAGWYGIAFFEEV